MMIKKTIFLGATILAFASCSNDEIITVDQKADAINFAVAVSNSTRAADIYCSNNYMPSFNVWATVDENGAIDTYIKNTQVAVDENGACTTANVHYWPSTGTLNFYATNMPDAATWDGTTLAFENFTVNDEVSAQEDLLYAVTPDQEKSSSAVNLNFRHALAQVVFNAKTSNPCIHVVVKGVGLTNIYNTGTFTLPETTETSYINHSGTESSTTLASSGVWSDLSGEQFCKVSFDPVALTSTVQSLTANVTDSSAGVSGGETVMIVMPQEKEAWTATTDDSDGFYFAIIAKIYNVADETAYNEATDVQIFPDQEAYPDVEYGYILIPADISWNSGYKYTYTLNFGNGNLGINGGVDTDGTEKPEPGGGSSGSGGGTVDPVVVAITYEVTVDDFYSGSIQTVEAEYSTE